ncbi:LicD family protein [Blautia segnis]|uniref:LicD family protein n=1 Tax=Blautia segnis TaxID=2763030 RepID=A0A8I0DQ19_9FIRM|nr:LicD family protein [Blautia segnis]MBC5652219.1 LicD family protein [Blautia segnis]
MTEKQQYLLKLFREIDEMCKKHNLRYVMAGGSLIGVARNEGFIPWDDDVDIYMPRDDWDKLVELSDQVLPPNRAFQCVDVDRNYTNTFPRYASTDTCAIHRHQIIGKDKAGEIIDVLTLDPIPDDDREYEKYRTHLMIYSDLINIAVVYGNRYEVPVHLYLKYLFSYLFLGKERTLKKLEKIMFSYKEEECSRYAMRWGGCPFLFDKDMMFPVKYGRFEGVDVMIPNKVSDYLIWHYGDEWSYIPPHGERESHDAVECHHMNYEEFRKEYMPKLDTFRLRKDAVFRKLYYMATAKRSHRLIRKRQELLGEATAQDLMNRLEQKKVSLEALLEKRDFHTLNQIFGDYFRVQLSADFIGREEFVHIYNFYHPVLIDIKEEVFMAAMLTLLYSEKVSKAYRMLRVREKLQGLSPAMEALLQDILTFRSAACHYEFGENRPAEWEMDQLLEKYPDNPSFLKFKIRFLMERAKKEKPSEEAEEFLSHCLELFPEDGYFLKYKGDLLWLQGKCREALDVYVAVRSKTTNGMTQLELDKFLKEHKMSAMGTCKSLVEKGNVQEAVELAALWKQLLPEDESIDGYFCLMKLEGLNRPEEIREFLKDIKEKLLQGKSEKTGKLKIENMVYLDICAYGAEKLGFSRKLAKLGTELLYTEDMQKLEELLSQALEQASKEECKPAAFLIAGDILYKQGKTCEAFSYYRKALKKDAPEYVRIEGADRVLKDLKDGSSYIRSFGRKQDLTEFLDAWLGKYESLEEIKELLKAIV